MDNRRISKALTLEARRVLIANVIVCSVLLAVVLGGTEEEAKKWLEELEPKYDDICQRKALMDWEVGANLTDHAMKLAAETDLEFTNVTLEIQQTVIKKFPNWKEFKDKRLRRALKFLSLDGPGDFPISKVEHMNEMGSKMEAEFSKATVCKYKEPTNCSIRLQEIGNIMKATFDTDEASYYWHAWHNKMSEKVSPQFYKEFVDLDNGHVNANGFKFISDEWLLPYDDESEGWTTGQFEKVITNLEEEIQDIYEILHAYARMKLRQRLEYKDMLTKCGYIPAHITGNLWSSDWTKLHRITKPYPNTPSVDATDSMVKQGYTPLRIFQEADKFFKGLGLGTGNTEAFWKNSIFERPNDDREMDCHPSALDLCQGNRSGDFRIIQCTTITQLDLIIAHHEMGHIEYFKQYSNLEYIFRGSANPGFHEAIGDSIALAVVTPTHLQCTLGLDLGYPLEFCEKKPSPSNISEADLNYLYFVALDKLASFPFSIAIERWRWGVFEYKFPADDYNQKWWEYRRMYQGIVPPSDRNASNLFDPAAVNHIVAHVDYLRYFVANVIQFQFYEAMCIAAKEYTPNDPNSKPLFQCDFSGSKEAGKLIGNMMKMGFSQPWPEAMEAMTGSRVMSMSSFKKYLQPILDFMEKEIKAAGEVVGFGTSCEHAEQRKTRRKSGDPKWGEEP